MNDFNLHEFHLYRKLHGPHFKHLSHHKETKKDRFELALIDSVKHYANEIANNEDPSLHKFISFQTRCANLSTEILHDVSLTEFGEHIANAVNILQTEGTHYLSKEEFDAVLNELNLLRHRFTSLTLNPLEDRDLKDTLATPKNIQLLIQQVGISKFNTGLLSDSLSIFAFLSLLDSEDPNYWYRMGLIAQKMGFYELAMRSYKVAERLAPEFIGIRIFSSQCHLAIGQRDQALADLEEAKMLLKSIEDQTEWNKYLDDLGILLTQAA